MMFPYQSFYKKRGDEAEVQRDKDTTGHERFYQDRSTNRPKKKRRAVGRRTQSAIELDTEAMVSAQNLFRKGTSASTEEDESDEEKFILSSKIDNLAKILFNRVSIARGSKEHSEMYRNETQRYTALGSTACDEVVECLELEKRSKERALQICRAFIKKSTRYSLLQQLNNIGSRVDKHWFLVRDITLKTDRLMTLTPLNENCPINVCPPSQDILNNLFLALQHPYICPVLHLDILEYEEEFYVIVIQPINQGSLKDLIYGIEKNQWNEDWVQKYVTRGKGLPLPRVQQMGKQILEALVFLKDRDFPTVTHLHSGNVIVQNGVARLAGLENTLLGFTSRAHHSLSFRLARIDAIDTILFGHMIFEMCAGYELRTVEPTAEQMTDLDRYPQVAEFLQTIFDRTKPRRLSVHELLVHDFFRNIDLREMRSAPVTIFRPMINPSVTSLLEKIKRQNYNKRPQSFAGESMISPDTPSSTMPHSSSSLLDRLYDELTNTPV